MESEEDQKLLDLAENEAVVAFNQYMQVGVFDETERGVFVDGWMAAIAFARAGMKLPSPT